MTELLFIPTELLNGPRNEKGGVRVRIGINICIWSTAVVAELYWRIVSSRRSIVFPPLSPGRCLQRGPNPVATVIHRDDDEGAP